MISRGVHWFCKMCQLRLGRLLNKRRQILQRNRTGGPGVKRWDRKQQELGGQELGGRKPCLVVRWPCLCWLSVGKGVSVIPFPLWVELALFGSHEDAPAGTFLSSPASTAACLPPALISERGEQTLICLRHQAVSQAGFNDCPEASAKQPFYRCTLVGNSQWMLLFKRRT